MREKIIQSCLVTLVAGSIFQLFSIIFALGHFEEWHLVMSTSVASTAFVLFVFPHTATTRYRTVIGGHVVSVGAGFVVIVVATWLPLSNSWIYACAIGLSLLVMTLTQTIHPPASGTALTIAMAHTGSLWGNVLALTRIAIVVLVTVILLTISHYFLRHRLVNLSHPK